MISQYLENGSGDLFKYGLYIVGDTFSIPKELVSSKKKKNCGRGRRHIFQIGTFVSPLIRILETLKNMIWNVHDKL